MPQSDETLAASPLDAAAVLSVGFELDPRRSAPSLDLGFSRNVHNDSSKNLGVSPKQLSVGYPLTDLLAAVALSRCLVNYNALRSLAYATPSGILPLPLMRAAIVANEPIIAGMLTRRFQIERGKVNQNTNCIAAVTKSHPP